MLDHVGVRQAQDDRARAVADRCQAGRRAEAVETGDGAHDLGRHVEAADVVPGCGEPPGHRHAHVAEADPTDALGAHRPLPSGPAASYSRTPPARSPIASTTRLLIWS